MARDVRYLGGLGNVCEPRAASHGPAPAHRSVEPERLEVHTALQRADGTTRQSSPRASSNASAVEPTA